MHATDPDSFLLDRWRAHHDADAFGILVERHGTLVYSACLRVLRDATSAEDAAQECFIELMQSRARIRSLPAWLHTASTRRAIDSLRADRSRLEREARYGAEHSASVDIQWDDISDYIDEAVAALPKKLRGPVVLRFLQGKTYGEITREFAISTSTVTYRLNKGIEGIRKHLIRRGVPIATASLATLLSVVPAYAMPTAAAAHLGKLAMAAQGTSAASTASGAATLFHAASSRILEGVLTMKTVWILGGVTVVTFLSAPLLLGQLSRDEPTAEPTVMSSAEPIVVAAADLGPFPMREKL